MYVCMVSIRMYVQARSCRVCHFSVSVCACVCARGRVGEYKEAGLCQ